MTNQKTQDGETQRLFVAMPIAPEVVLEIHTLIEGLRTGFKFINVPMTWSRPENIHLTLSFLGEVSSTRIPELIQSVGQITARHRAFKLKGHEIGAFPDWQRPRVLWVGIGGMGTQLAELQSDIWNSTLGFMQKKEKNQFRPHVTIGRFKSFAGMDSAKNIIVGHRHFKTSHFMAEEVVIYRSVLSGTGAHHTRVQTLPLIGATSSD